VLVRGRATQGSREAPPGMPRRREVAATVCGMKGPEREREIGRPREFGSLQEEEEIRLVFFVLVLLFCNNYILVFITSIFSYSSP
jgi:hypothetical protein